MSLPPALFAATLSGAEFKTAVALFHLADGKGRVETTTESLAEFTGYSTESLRRAFRKLEALGLLNVERTRKYWGKFHVNVYQLTVEQQLAAEVAPSHTPVGSTRDYDVITTTATSDEVSSRKTRFARLTRARVARPIPKEAPKMVNRWRQEDEGQVIGALPDDSPKPTATARPHSAKDTAKDIAQRLRVADPYSAGLVNVRDLSILIAKMRRDWRFPLEVEKAMVDLFFHDHTNWNTLYRLTSKQVTGVLYNFFKTHLEQAHLTAGVTTQHPGTPSQVESQPSRIFASDGASFPDTEFGRINLRRYEKGLIK